MSDLTRDDVREILEQIIKEQKEQPTATKSTEVPWWIEEDTSKLIK